MTSDSGSISSLRVAPMLLAVSGLLAAAAPDLSAGEPNAAPSAPVHLDFGGVLGYDLALDVAWLEARRAAAPLLYAELAARSGPHSTACESAAWTAREGELTAARADFLLAVAKCVSARGSFARCLHQLRDDYRDAREQVFEQFRARLQVCRLLQEDRYAPDLDPSRFSSTIDNQFIPFVVGRTLVYRSDGDEVERTRVTTLDETLDVDGIECRVVRDTVRADGVLVEDTRDWFAQDDQGNVWYMGEIALNYEDGQVSDIDGSWTTGVDGAKAGIQMKAAPQVGDAYRQEFLLGEAEDLAQVVAVGQTVTVRAGTFHGCLQTEEWTPLEPGIVETKYYAPGVGFVLGVNQGSGERTELVRIIDPR